MKYLFEVQAEEALPADSGKKCISQIKNIFLNLGFTVFEEDDMDIILYDDFYELYHRFYATVSTSSSCKINYSCGFDPTKNGTNLNDYIESQPMNTTPSTGTRNNWRCCLTIARNEKTYFFGFGNHSDTNYNKDVVCYITSDGENIKKYVANFGTISSGGVPKNVYVKGENGLKVKTDYILDFTEIKPIGENKAVFRDSYVVNSLGFTDITYKVQHIHSVTMSGSYAFPTVVKLNDIEFFAMTNGLVMDCIPFEPSSGEDVFEEEIVE